MNIKIIDLVILFVLALLLAMALRAIIINKKTGKNSCGCGSSCANCPKFSACHMPSRDKLENTSKK